MEVNHRLQSAVADRGFERRGVQVVKLVRTQMGCGAVEAPGSRIAASPIGVGKIELESRAKRTCWRAHRDKSSESPAGRGDKTTLQAVGGGGESSTIDDGPLSRQSGG